MLNPNMPTQELLLYMGELTTNEMRVARAAIAWTNYMYDKPGCLSETPNSATQPPRETANNNTLFTNQHI